MVNGAHDPDGPAYSTLLYDLSNRIDSELVDLLRPNLRLPQNILSLESTDWLSVQFSNMGHADVHEAQSSQSTADDWYNYIVFENDNVDKGLEKVLNSMRDHIDVAREIRRLVIGRKDVVMYANWIYNGVLFEPTVGDVPGFWVALDKFVEKGVNAKHLKRITSEINGMQPIYNTYVYSMSELVSMTVTLRYNYIDQVNSVKQSLKSLKQEGNLYTLRDTVHSLKAAQDQLVTALADLHNKMEEYNNQRDTWAQSMMGIKYGKKM